MDQFNLIIFGAQFGIAIEARLAGVELWKMLGS
jgi:hypothetical protein